MFKLLVHSVAVAAVWGFPRAGKPSSQRLGRSIPTGRIVGGDDAEIADYPYTLALLFLGSQAGGASLIGSKWALTTAFSTSGYTADQFSVRAGSTDLHHGQVVDVATIYQHPQFDLDTLDYDIGVLELAEDVVAPNAAPIALHDSGYTAEEGAGITITGWGKLAENNPVPPRGLQVLVTQVVSNEVCDEAYGELAAITDRTICAGNLENGGEDACYQDLGDPLVVEGKLYGLASWGNGCGRPGYPGVNTKVSEASIREFIENITGL